MIFCIILNIDQLVVNITVTLLPHLETKIVLETLMHRYFGEQINLNKDKTEILIGAPNMMNALIKEYIKVAN